MQNQIQLYHDLTAFWLDKDWQTPKEKQLGKQLAELRQRLESLKVFEDIPCSRCNKPMTSWTRDQVLQAFKDWHHTLCTQ
ncbi:MAG: hypothetical protein JW967_09185 [Dehalococcoidales bacterium]|nr:hypothetical protein [Dehalococcoidales bacterium]